MAVLAADLYIVDDEQFRRSLTAAELAAREQHLVTLAIKPRYPSSGYGYIQQGERLLTADGFDVYRADRFVEKPDPDAARRMVDSGRFSWNSGMFIWRVERILEEFQRQMGEFYGQLQEVAAVMNQPEYAQVLERVWPAVNKETIDYGVMEGADDVVVIPVDAQGNTVVGQHVGIDTTDTLVVGEDRLIATIGLEGLVIVDTKDALLVCTKEREQDVRQLVKLLETSGRRDLL